jgi:hypothetical protein
MSKPTHRHESSSAICVKVLKGSAIVALPFCSVVSYGGTARLRLTR